MKLANAASRFRMRSNGCQVAGAMNDIRPPPLTHIGTTVPARPANWPAPEPRSRSHAGSRASCTRSRGSERDDEIDTLLTYMLHVHVWHRPKFFQVKRAARNRPGDHNHPLPSRRLSSINNNRIETSVLMDRWNRRADHVCDVARQREMVQGCRYSGQNDLMDEMVGDARLQCADAPRGDTADTG